MYKNSRRYRTVLSLILMLQLLLVAGCNIVAAAVVVVAPTLPISAKYKISDKKTLVLVEDPGRIVINPNTTRIITSAIIENMTEEGDFEGGFVDPAEINVLRDELGSDAFDKLPLGTLAKRLGAGQVVYVLLENFSVNATASVFQPAMSANVKVLDIDQGIRVFPLLRDEETGIETGIEYHKVTTSLTAKNYRAQGQAAHMVVSRDLALQGGTDIGRLFHSWKRDEPGSALAEP